jgi:CheY-like chemotaxis protein
MGRDGTSGEHLGSHDSMDGPEHQEPAPARAILVVDDEAAVRRAAKRVLDRAGYRVVEACDGRDALRIMEDEGERFDLVLTDVAMPGMGGRELYDRLATRLPHTPVLLMSGYTDDESLRDGVRQSAVAFLPKPFTPRALLDAVTRTLPGAAGTTETETG